MRRISKVELKEVLRLHALWLDSKDGGVRADSRGADLRSSDFRAADLRCANLTGASLSFADLHGANLSFADLHGANLCHSWCLDSNLENANLTGAILCEADLRGAYLRGANLTGANLSGAHLELADLTDANLSGAVLSKDIKALQDAKAHLFQKPGRRKCFAVPAFQGKNAVLWIIAGCFKATLDEFEQAAKETYPDDPVQAYAPQIAELRELFKAHLNSK
jgi:hypothetical protein